MAAEKAAAAVGGTITSGDAIFTRTSSSFDSTPAAQWSGVSSPGTANHLFELGWWIRLSTALPEVPFGDPIYEAYTADSSDIQWGNNVGGTGLIVREEATISDGHVAGQPADGGVLELFLPIDNNTNNPISVTVTHYFDYDLLGSPGDDSAIHSDYGGLFQIRDGSSVAYVRYETATPWSVGPGAWSVAPFPTLRDSLNDGGQTTLNDCCTPFGPADFSGGLQWNVNLPAGSHSELTVYHSVNASLTCGLLASLPSNGVFCDGFESGDGLFWSTLLP